MERLVDRPDGPGDLRDFAVHLKQGTTDMGDGPVGEPPIPQAPPWRQEQPLLAWRDRCSSPWDKPMHHGQWRRLSELEPLALCKLGRPGHDHHNPVHALAEFKIT